MCLGKIITLLSLLTLTLAQGDDSCKCSGVIVTSQEELAQHIQWQVRVALRGEPIQPPSSGMIFGGCTTHENVTEEMNKLKPRLHEALNPGWNPG